MTQTHGATVKQRILTEGVRLWRSGPDAVTTRAIARALEITHGTVIYHFSSARELRDAIAFHAVQASDSRVIVHLIAAKHPAIVDMSAADRQRHLEAVR